MGGCGQCGPMRGNSQPEEREKLSDILPKTNRHPNYQCLRTSSFYASASWGDRPPGARLADTGCQSVDVALVSRTWIGVTDLPTKRYCR